MSPLTIAGLWHCFCRQQECRWASNTSSGLPRTRTGKKAVKRANSRCPKTDPLHMLLASTLVCLALIFVAIGSKALTERAIQRKRRELQGFALTMSGLREDLQLARAKTTVARGERLALEREVLGREMKIKRLAGELRKLDEAEKQEKCRRRAREAYALRSSRVA